MKALFRADATPALGAGHVMRCMALAGELRSRGTEIHFVVGAGSELAARLAAAKNFPCRRLPAEPSRDAGETARIVAHERIDWVVVDHYSLDAAWEKEVRRAGASILVIEDLSGREHDCDLLVNAGFGAEATVRARALLGPEYALLAPEFREARERDRERDGTVRRILVGYGGTDPSNETCKALEALAALGASGLEVEVAVGAGFAHEDALRAAAQRLPAATLRRGLPHLADLMQSCDLALGAGGTSSWERLCLGLPALVSATAANQARGAAALGAAGYFLYLGPAERVTSEAMTQALLRRIANPDALRRESARGRALVDGAGAARVADAMAGA